MPSRSELTPALRERICELHSAAQWGYKRIHKRYPWISLSTIRYTIKKEHERRAGVSKPRSGRPKKLDKSDKVRLFEAIHGNPRITREDLLTKVSYKVKTSSIRRLLNAENLRNGDIAGDLI
jgi:transposase